MVLKLFVSPDVLFLLLAMSKDLAAILYLGVVMRYQWCYW